MVFDNRRYSQFARRSLIHARLLTQKHRHPFIDTAHVLVGIWLTEGSLGYQVLQEFHIDRTQAEKTLIPLHPQQADMPKSPPYSESLETALLMAKDEARWLGHHYIGTEHILLGLVRAGSGQAPRLLRILKISDEQIRRRVRRLLSEDILEINLEAARRLARLSELSKRVLNATTRLADDLNYPAAGLPHLLLSLARERRSAVAHLLIESGLTLDKLTADVENSSNRDAEKLALALDDVLDRAVDRAEALGTHYTGTEHILLALTLDHRGQALLSYYNVDVEWLQAHIRAELKK